MGRENLLVSRRTVANRPLPKLLPLHESILLLGKIMAENDFVLQSSISFIDSISMQRFRRPCRALGCKHLQCFEYDVYLQTNEKRVESEYRCPVCEQISNPSKIYIDSVMASIILIVRDDPSQESVSFADTAIFTLNEKAQGSNSGNNTIIEIIDSDDEAEESGAFYRTVKATNSSSSSNCGSSEATASYRKLSDLASISAQIQEQLEGIAKPPDDGTSSLSSLQLTSLEQLARPSVADILYMLNKDLAGTSKWGLDAIPLLPYITLVGIKACRPFEASTIEGLSHAIQQVKGVGPLTASKIISNLSDQLQEKLNNFKAYIRNISLFKTFALVQPTSPVLKVIDIAVSEAPSAMGNNIEENGPSCSLEDCSYKKPEEFVSTGAIIQAISKVDSTQDQASKEPKLESYEHSDGSMGDGRHTNSMDAAKSDSIFPKKPTSVGTMQSGLAVTDGVPKLLPTSSINDTSSTSKNFSNTGEGSNGNDNCSSESSSGSSSRLLTGAVRDERPPRPGRPPPPVHCPTGVMVTNGADGVTATSPNRVDMGNSNSVGESILSSSSSSNGGIAAYGFASRRYCRMQTADRVSSADDPTPISARVSSADVRSRTSSHGHTTTREVPARSSTSQADPTRKVSATSSTSQADPTREVSATSSTSQADPTRKVSTMSSNIQADLWTATATAAVAAAEEEEGNYWMQSGGPKTAAVAAAASNDPGAALTGLVGPIPRTSDTAPNALVVRPIQSPSDTAPDTGVGSTAEIGLEAAAETIANASSVLAAVAIGCTKLKQTAKQGAHVATAAEGTIYVGMKRKAAYENPSAPRSKPAPESLDPSIKDSSRRTGTTSGATATARTLPVASSAGAADVLATGSIPLNCIRRAAAAAATTTTTTTTAALTAATAVATAATAATAVATASHPGGRNGGSLSAHGAQGSAQSSHHQERRGPPSPHLQQRQQSILDRHRGQSQRHPHDNKCIEQDSYHQQHQQPYQHLQHHFYQQLHQYQHPSQHIVHQPHYGQPHQYHHQNQQQYQQRYQQQYHHRQYWPPPLPPPRPQPEHRSLHRSGVPAQLPMPSDASALIATGGATLGRGAGIIVADTTGSATESATSTTLQTAGVLAGRQHQPPQEARQRHLGQPQQQQQQVQGQGQGSGGATPSLAQMMVQDFSNW